MFQNKQDAAEPQEGGEESPARLSNTLFSLWNSYSEKLPVAYFASKLIATGDYLYKVRDMNRPNQEILVPDWLITSHVA